MLKSETFSLRDSSEVCACTQLRDDPIDKPNPAGSSLSSRGVQVPQRALPPAAEETGTQAWPGN